MSLWSPLVYLVSLGGPYFVGKLDLKPWESTHPQVFGLGECFVAYSADQFLAS
jgi:hypothetical protein